MKNTMSNPFETKSSSIKTLLTLDKSKNLLSVLYEAGWTSFGAYAFFKDRYEQSPEDFKFYHRENKIFITYLNHKVTSTSEAYFFGMLGGHRITFTNQEHGFALFFRFWRNQAAKW